MKETRHLGVYGLIINNGKIALDISGKDKENMTEELLLKTYSNSFSDITLLKNN